jgi:hypothetical protein
MGFHTPFSVLVIGGIVGIFVFAASSAFMVWFKRNQSASEPEERTASLCATLLKLGISAGVVVGIVFAMNAIQPHTFLEQEGLLVGKDLFTVRSRTGFIAEYPRSEWESTATTEYVEQGQVLVSFRPNPDPKEVAAASHQKDILQEQLALERSRRPAVDPALQNQLDGLEQRLDILNQRQKELLNRRESYLRDETKTNTTGNSEYRQIEKQAVTVHSEYKQTEVRLQAAEMEMQWASELLQRNLISQQEKHSRVAAYHVLRSKLDELRERARLLDQEKAAIRSSLLEARQRTREQLAGIDQWLTEVTAAKQQAAAEYDEVSKRLQEESIHGHERHSSRIRQIELQLAEVNALIPRPELPARMEVRAPWSGYVGYRDLSPASLRPDTGPLVVMYKPDHIWVELQAPTDLMRDLTGDNTRVTVATHGPSSAHATFAGYLERKQPLPDEKTMALRVSTAPPASLVRKLALGEELQAFVHISSKGFAVDGLFEKIPAALRTNHASLPYAGLSFVVILTVAWLLSLVIAARRRRRTIAKELVSSTPHHTPLVVSNHNLPTTRIDLNTPSHVNGARLSNLQNHTGFVYDFTNGFPEPTAEPHGMSQHSATLPMENPALLKLERIIGQQTGVVSSTYTRIEPHGAPSASDGPEHFLYSCQILGARLNQSIITNNVDLSLMDALREQLAQKGIWVLPFIASALRRDIHDELLLAYSINLCVKRLSAVQHKAEFEPAVSDLTGYLFILQRFFPTPLKRIMPNLQQGMTMALHIVTARVEAEVEENTVLTMLRQVLADIGVDRPEGRPDRQ